MNTLELTLQNIKCDGCVKSIKTAMEKHTNIKEVNVVKETGKVTIVGEDLVNSTIVTELASIGFPEVKNKPNHPNMKANMGSLDKAIRIILAIVFAMLYVTKMVEGTVATILLVLGGIFLVTSIISFCPLYTLFGISTCKTKK